jgi:hypothetical protein
MMIPGERRWRALECRSGRLLSKARAAAVRCAVVCGESLIPP